MIGRNGHLPAVVHDEFAEVPRGFSAAMAACDAIRAAKVRLQPVRQLIPPEARPVIKKVIKGSDQGEDET